MSNIRVDDGLSPHKERKAFAVVEMVRSGEVDYSAALTSVAADKDLSARVAQLLADANAVDPLEMSRLRRGRILRMIASDDAREAAVGIKLSLDDERLATQREAAAAPSAAATELRQALEAVKRPPVASPEDAA